MKTRRPTNISRSSAKHVRGCISSTEKPVSCWARRTTAFRLGAIDGSKSGTGSIWRWIGWSSHSDKGSKATLIVAAFAARCRRQRTALALRRLDSVRLMPVRLILPLQLQSYRRPGKRVSGPLQRD